MTSVVTLFDERAERAGLSVDPELKEKLLSYYSLLTRWNEKINLTALTDPAAAIDRLLIEPVSAAPYLPLSTPMADLGSGGGSPAIPLALVLRAPSLLMVESRSRKAAFLREAARVVGINATVEAVRFEDVEGLSRWTASVGLVSIRAVTPDATVLSLAARLCQARGTVALFAASDLLVELPKGSFERSTWNIRPSGMLITFHVEHN